MMKMNAFVERYFDEVMRFKDAYDGVFIVGVDGPTASGKTIIARALQSECRQNGYVCDIFELDWLLSPRKDRQSDLKSLNSSGNKFSHEDVFHMRLDKLEDLLSAVKAEEFAKPLAEKQFILDNLYDRANDGQCTKRVEFSLAPRSVLIVEGHYTLRKSLDQYIDYNIVLMSDTDTLIERKIERVKDYRSDEAVIKYFQNIDYPSFKKHFWLYHRNADLIIDNSDYNNPMIIDTNTADRLFVLDQTNADISGNSLDDLSQKIFGLTDTENVDLKSFRIFNQQITGMRKLINYVLTTSLGQVGGNLSEDFYDLLTRAYDDDTQIRLLDTSNLGNTFLRQFPISFNVAIKQASGNLEQLYLCRIESEAIEILLIWKGGINRYLLNNKGHWDYRTLIKSEKKLALVPSPDFINNLRDLNEYRITYTGLENKNIDEFSFLLQIFSNSSVYAIKRYEYVIEAELMSKFLNFINIESIIIGNYLFIGDVESFKFNNTLINNPYLNSDKLLDNLKADFRKQLALIQTIKTREDVLLSIEYPGSEMWEHFVNEIILLLNNDNRLVRKAAYKMLERYLKKFSALLDSREIGDLLNARERAILYFEASLAEKINFECTALNFPDFKKRKQISSKDIIVFNSKNELLEALNYRLEEFIPASRIGVSIELLEVEHKIIDSLCENWEVTQVFIWAPFNKDVCVEKVKSFAESASSWSTYIADKILHLHALPLGVEFVMDAQVVANRVFTAEEIEGMCGHQYQLRDLDYFKYDRFKFNAAQLDKLATYLKDVHAVKSGNIINAQFSPSMIEVSDLNKFREYSKFLISRGVKNFHIDVGDGEFIKRKISAVDKVETLRSISEDITISVHLMSREPHANKKGEKQSIIKRYATAGATNIGIHRKAFLDSFDFEACLSTIANEGCVPGIVLEVDEDWSADICKLVAARGVGWILIMSVDIGYGGQLFNANVLPKLKMISETQIVKSNNITLEIDGGIAFNNLKQCKSAGAHVIAGWSIIASDNLSDINEKLQSVKEILG